MTISEITQLRTLNLSLHSFLLASLTNPDY